MMYLQSVKNVLFISSFIIHVYGKHIEHKKSKTNKACKGQMLCGWFYLDITILLTNTTPNINIRICV